MHLDHVAYARSDLDTLVEAFERAGFTPEYGGVHATGTTHMSLVTFPDGSYLELLSTTPGTDPADAGFWAEHIAADAGPAGWCIVVDDTRAWAKQCIDTGLPVDGPRTAGRERDDGQHVEWEMVFVGDGETHPFAITDRTPREYRVPAVDAGDEASVLTGVADVVVAVSDLDATVDEFRRSYRFPTPTQWTDNAFGARLAAFPGQPVTLAEPSSAESWLTDRLDDVGPGPCAYLLGTDDVDAASTQYALSSPTAWGGERSDRRVSWVDSDLLGTTVGVVGDGD